MQAAAAAAAPWADTLHYLPTNMRTAVCQGALLKTECIIKLRTCICLSHSAQQERHNFSNATTTSRDNTLAQHAVAADLHRFNRAVLDTRLQPAYVLMNTRRVGRFSICNAAFNSCAVACRLPRNAAPRHYFNTCAPRAAILHHLHPNP